jgi:hypothetical protein
MEHARNVETALNGLGAEPLRCLPSVSRNSVTTSLYRRPLLDAFEKAPASIAAIAISIATCADFTSTPVTNLASVRRLVVIIMAFPLARSTLARHFPGSRSKARTMNCLYSTAKDFRLPKISVPATTAVQRKLVTQAERSQSQHHFSGLLCRRTAFTKKPTEAPTIAPRITPSQHTVFIHQY